MMPSPLASKLGFKPTHRAFLVDVPDTVRAELALPSDAVADGLRGEFDFILACVDDAAQLDSAFTRLQPHVSPRGTLWISWRKASQGGTSLRLPEVIRIGYEHRMVESKTVSVNQAWSAMKFTHPKPGKEYQNSYGQLPS